MSPAADCLAAVLSTCQVFKYVITFLAYAFAIQHLASLQLCVIWQAFVFKISSAAFVSLSVFECDVSETIHELVIVRLSLISGSVIGGDEMIILCEKVKKGRWQHYSSFIAKLLCSVHLFTCFFFLH